MPKLSRTEMLSTVPCSKFRGTSFFVFMLNITEKSRFPLKQNITKSKNRLFICFETYSTIINITKTNKRFMKQKT